MKNQRLLRTHRWSRRILIAVASLPLLQAGGCDPSAIFFQITAGFVNSAAVSLSQVALQSVITTLLNAFPGSNILRTLFVNGIFFPGL